MNEENVFKFSKLRYAPHGVAAKPTPQGSMHHAIFQVTGGIL
jgi:hypothetical protein